MKVPRVENDYGIVTCKNVGFSKIAEQYSMHAAETGFLLNVMIVGRKGLGSSTLINSLFSAPLVQKNRPTKFTTTLNEIIEDGVNNKLSRR